MADIDSQFHVKTQILSLSANTFKSFLWKDRPTLSIFKQMVCQIRQGEWTIAYLSAILANKNGILLKKKIARLVCNFNSYTRVFLHSSYHSPECSRGLCAYLAARHTEYEMMRSQELRFNEIPHFSDFIKDVLEWNWIRNDHQDPLGSLPLPVTRW